MFTVTPIPALRDNYIWAIHNQQHLVIIDPGEAEPVFEFLRNHPLQLIAILCTHRHPDHIGGVEKIRSVYNVPVYGRAHPKNPHISHDLREANRLTLAELNLDFTIWEVPGHLEDHIAYYQPDMVFCGDILFGAGCGRNFEGSMAELHHSLQRLAQLPEHTAVYCSHEYTAANLRFAITCEPNNLAIQQRIKQVQQQKLTLPSNIALEKATNPFLRCTSPELMNTLRQRGANDMSELGVFTELRTWKNTF